LSISQETLKLYYNEVADDIIKVYQSASKEPEKLDKTCRTALGDLVCGKKTKRNQPSAERQKKRVTSDYFSLMQEIKRLERPRI
jgi:non-homologous end joining protein Ku